MTSDEQVLEFERDLALAALSETWRALEAAHDEIERAGLKPVFDRLSDKWGIEIDEALEAHP